MASPRLLLLLALGSLGSCDPQPPAAARNSALRVAATCAPDELAATLRAHPSATMVLSLGGDPDAALAAASAAGREQPPFVVVVGGRPGAGDLPDAWIEAPIGADVAVALALLACRGTPAANTAYSIGARTWDQANRAAGGARTLAPADAIVAMLRQQQAAALTTGPADAPLHRVAFVTAPGEAAAQKATRAAARAAAARYPQLELTELHAAAEAADAGAGALIAATRDPSFTRAVAASAVATGAPPSIIVLDPMLQDAHQACRIGCAPETIARAAAGRARSLLPEGGELIVCAPAGDDDWIIATRDALAAALGADPESLR